MSASRDLSDPQRPSWHFTAPRGWLNDPVGLGHHGGWHHVFYQYNPHAACWSMMHWGQARTRDFTSWEDAPLALLPGTPHDREGCWSGSLVYEGGVPTLVYTGVSDPTHQAGSASVNVAPGVEGPDGSLHGFRAHPQAVLRWPRSGEVPGLTLTAWRDPTLRRVEGEDGRGEWRLVVGIGTEERGGGALLYAGEDLRTWRLLGALLLGEAGGEDPGEVWECAQLLDLGEAAMLIASRMRGGGPDGTLAVTGTLRGDAFEVTRGEPLDHSPLFYAPQAYRAPGERLLLIGWVREVRPADIQLASGWSGALSVPREIEVREGRVWQTPARELLTLRERAVCPGELLPTRLDLDLRLPGGGSFVIEQDGHPLVRLEGNDGEVSILTSSHVVTLPSPGASLRLLLDASVVEVFADGRSATLRTAPEHRLCTLTASGGATCRGWTLSPAFSQTPGESDRPAD
ncbi:glycosyl hydrolase family 32 (plasmid) [Deinococcus aetherius]|uniref:beta-fructofuranosidase n=1 Tax=Deinococcus aetherius TaxID=200252 RepID=A0ABN6RL73_9DEIO|nr:glycoside hydrolase family 32 protein [Deinococcus aetherius]BDP43518.1 glycosyl hydrolase family 32 [Deinococcus aetherius]